MSRMREGDVAIALSDLEKLATQHAPELVDRVRSLRGHLDHIGAESTFATLVQDVHKLLAASQVMMELQQPIIDRGVLALESLAESERRRAILEEAASGRKAADEAHTREMESLRLQRIWIPAVTTVAGALASALATWAAVGS